MTGIARLTAGIVIGAVCVGLLEARALAQDGLRSPVLPDRAPSQPLPQFPPAADIYRVPPDFYQQPPRQRPFPPIWWGGGGGYWGGGSGYWGNNGFVWNPYQPFGNQRPAAGVEPGDGFLRLNVRPLTTEVYVDGVFRGKAVDFDTASGRPVAAGLRRIDLRSPEGKSVSVDLRVVGGETVTYTGSLEAAAPPAPPVRAPKRTFYVIERCYAGDSAPDPAKLPPGCSIGGIRTYER